jgi:allophanate hydrolase
MPPSGPADPFAFAAAQALVGNDLGAAGFEIVGAPFTFAAEDRRIVAVTGRDVSLRANHRIAGWTAAFVRAGEEVTVIIGDRTRFAYLAVSGGLDTAPVLGSRAASLRAGIGAPVRQGDSFRLGQARIQVERAGLAIAPPRYQDEIVRAITGPHAERFPEEAEQLFFSATFVVDTQSDRMATRLAGPSLRASAGEILTCGVVAGAAQVPPGGAPIVLLAEHQTTGGYPIIATVIAADQGRLAQRLPGESVRFARFDRDRAVDELRRSRAALAAMA